MEYINKLLHRSLAIPARTPSPTPLSGNDNSLQKTAEHEVKVRFAREFADVGSITYSAPESLSSASSFHSLSSSLSTKSSSGICPDSVPLSPNETSNISYVNTSIPDVEDLISACADIHLDSEEDRSFGVFHNTQDLSQDQTFASATDEPVADLTKDFPIEDSCEDSQNVTQVIESNSTTHDSTCSTLNRTQDIQDRPILGTICIRDTLSVDPYVSNNDGGTASKVQVLKEEHVSPNKHNEIISPLKTQDFTNDLEENSLPHCSVENDNLNSTVCLSQNNSNSDIIKSEEKDFIENTSGSESLSSNLALCSTISSGPSLSTLIENIECPSLPSISTTSLLTEDSEQKLGENFGDETTEKLSNLLAASTCSVQSTDTAISPAVQDILQNSTVQDQDNENSTQSPTTVCGLTNDEKSCANVVNEVSVSQKSPEIQKNFGINIHDTLELTKDTVAPNKVEVSAEKHNLSLNDICTSNDVPDLWIAEKVKPVESAITEKLKEFDNVDDIIQVKEEKKEGEEEAEGKENSYEDKLDTTLTLEDASLNLEARSEIEQYTEFKPQRQSTTLALSNEQDNFEALKFAAEEVANDIFKSSLEFSEESDRFVSATSEIFQDPTSFDFLLARSNSKTINRLRTESLYVKFDPLVADLSMLPQGNTQPISEEQNGKNDTQLPNVGTPKRNPAIAAIDRLLFYSPLPSGTVQKAEKPQEKIEQPVEESKPDAALISDINMSKELELVRATVLQLEEELEKQKKEYEAELEKQSAAFQERINKLQTQIAQEVKSKSQMTVVVEEYEKSISRLLTERERDRTNFEQEKTKLQEELQAANVHLTNTEAAFNDVHQKYERLKGVVSAYKSNETVLKESIQENMETIKGLETRYDQLKNHAMAQLEKANFELDAIRKQHEDETVKLHAMVRKAELKSNSLAELVEQKTKENKELTQILDEVIARVGHQNAE